MRDIRAYDRDYSSRILLEFATLAVSEEKSLLQRLETMTAERDKLQKLLEAEQDKLQELRKAKMER